MAPQLNVAQSFQAKREADKLAAWVKSEYNRIKSTRLVYERQWYLNYAFYKGRQNVAFLRNNSDPAWAGRLVEPPMPPHRVRHITNIVKPIIRTEYSRLTSNKPNASVVPASTEDQDLFAAQAAEQLWESIYYEKKLHKTYGAAAFWVCITGNGFVKDWWDENKVCTSGGQEYLGDMCFGAVTPFHMFIPDMNEVEIENQPFLLNAYTKPVFWTNKFYQGDYRADVTSSSEIMGEGFFKTQSGSQKPDSVLIIELWIKPGIHDLFPEGGMATWVNEKIVTIHTDGMPYQHGQYPFTHFTHIPTGEFYADSVINDLVSPQKEYNRTRSQIIEAKNRMAKPQLAAPRGSVDPAKITTMPGQVILYQPGMNPPTPIPLQALPSYVMQELDRTRADMEDISSQHEISRGQVPSGVTAATAISYLQERDDSPLSATYQSIEFGWEKIARHTISHVNQFWEAARIVSGTGVDGAFDAISLKGSDLRSGMDIRMEAGSALPISKAAKQAFLMDCMKMGYIEPTKGLSMMDMGGVNKLYDELKADERQAKRENLRMRNLQIQDIEMHVAMVTQAEYAAEQYATQQAAIQGVNQPSPLEVVPQPEPSLPPEQQDAQATMAMQQDQMDQQMQQPEPVVQGDAGFGQDQNTGAPLVPSRSLVPVNTWDNDQVHINEHNLFRKSQAFDILPEAVKAQFEYHVALHVQKLNQAAMNAQAQMPLNPLQDPTQGAHNGAGTPLGSNQFGPPGTQDGQLPPVGGQNG